MELNNWGKTLSYIRKNKAIPVKDVIGTKLTRSAYSRFVSGKTQTSIENFSFMLNNLHITFEEFEYIKNEYEPNRYQKFLLRAQKATYRQDELELENLLNKLKNYVYVTNETVPLHFLCITQLTINKIRGEEYDEYSRKIITEYLQRCESWTHYELILFNNVMFIFDLSLIKIMKKRLFIIWKDIKIYEHMGVKVLGR